jgi:hypothetical protein
MYALMSLFNDFTVDCIQSADHLNPQHSTSLWMEGILRAHLSSLYQPFISARSLLFGHMAEMIHSYISNAVRSPASRSRLMYARLDDNDCDSAPLADTTGRIH